MPKLITIDGFSGTLKSTYAKKLERELDGVRLVHTDDFFYPRGSKKDPRSGNFDTKRFIEEVIPHLAKRDGFFVRAFDCKSQTYVEKIVKEAEITILEGSYSSTSILEKYRDLSIYLDAPSYIREERVRKREKDNFIFFKKRWFIDEIKYVKKYQPQKKSIIIRNYEDLKELICGVIY